MFDKQALPEKMASSKRFIACGDGLNGKKPVKGWRNPQTWRFFDDAIVDAKDENFIGYTFPSNNDIKCIDFDHVLADGKPIQEFEDLYEFLIHGDVKTYIEYSKSGTGLHLFLENVTEPIILPDGARQYVLPDGTESPFWTETFGHKASLKYVLLTGKSVSDNHKSVLASGADADILLRAIQAWAYQYLQKDAKKAYENQQAGASCEFPQDIDISSLDPRMQNIVLAQFYRVKRSSEGCGNILLNTAALILGHYCPRYISQTTIELALEHAAEECGLTGRDGIAATRNTIESGLKKGMSEPQELGLAKQTESKMSLKELQAMSLEEFEEPLLLGSDSVPEIDTEHLPKALASIVDELSEKLELPPSLVLVPALAIPATVAQRKYRVRVNDSFSVPLTMYCLGVASPANKKTSIFTHTSEILDSIADAKNRETADERAANAELRKTYSQALAALEKGKKNDIEKIINPKPGSVSKDNTEETEADICSLIREVNDTYKQKVDEIQGKMPESIDEVDFYIGGDTNLESLFLLAEKSDGYMAVLDDEGKFFEIITGLYNDGRVDTDLLTKGYDGSRVTRARVSELKETGKPKVIEHAHLTASFIIQPTVFQDMAKTSSRKVRGRGVYGRFLIAFPETYIGHRKNENRAIDRTVFSDFNAAIERVFNLKLWTDQFGNEQKEVLRLSEGAENVCKEFIQCVETLMQPTGDFAEIQDWAGKAIGHIHRLAGLFHLFTEEAQGGSLIISEETMRQAVYVLSTLSYHALRFFNAVSEPEDVQLAKRISRWLTEQEKDVFSQRDVQQRFKSSCHKVEDLQPSLKMLEDRSYIYAIRSEPSGERGRPRGPLYFVNPKVREAQDANA